MTSHSPTSQTHTASGNSSGILLTIYLSALAVRGIYSICIYAYMGDAGILGVDSGDYVDQGRLFASALSNGTLQSWDILGPKPIMMPLYTWTLAANVLVAGKYAPLLYVLLQGALDSGTCLLIYGMARTIDQRIAMPAAIAAVFNPTQIVIAGQVYPDAPFVFFIALFLFGALRWLQTPSWHATMMIAAGLAVSSWYRILVTPYAPALVLFLLLVIIVKRRFRPIHLAQAFSVISILTLSLTPISLRNHTVYSSWALTPQIGMHLARWVVPLVWETNGRMSWADGHQEMERRAAQLPHGANENPFHQSSRYTAVSTEALKEIGIGAIAKAWLYGTAINLGTPAIILSPPIAALPRTGFYATPGHSAWEKIGNFIFRFDNNLYGWTLLIGIAGIVIIRTAQLFGVLELLLRRHIAATMLLISWCLFIFVVNGPVASPKYRLPTEPAFAITTGFGWRQMRRKMPVAYRSP